MSAIPQNLDIKYRIFTLEKGDELARGKDGWIAYLQHKKLDATSIIPSDLKTGLNAYIKKQTPCIVAVHGHGAAPDLQTKGQCIYTSDPRDRDDYESKQKYMQAHKNAQLNAKEFADYLVKKGLPKEVQELQVLACYTDVFAKDLAQELAVRGYENTAVVGYKEEFSICQGFEGSSIAGLCPELTPGLYENEKIIWKKLTEEIRIKHAADKHEARYNTSNYLKHRKEGASVTESSSSSAAAASDVSPSPGVAALSQTAAAASSSSISAPPPRSLRSTDSINAAEAEEETASEARIVRARAEAAAAALATISAPPQYLNRQLRSAEPLISGAAKTKDSTSNEASKPEPVKHKGPH